MKTLKDNRIVILGIIFIFISVLLLSISLRGKNVTQSFFDPIRVTNEREEVLVIGIDDKSLQEIGAWPFDRKVFADVTKKLSEAGVKVIAYDVLFLEERSGDDEFRDVLKNVKSTVIFASKKDTNEYYESFLADKNNKLTTSAIANILPDSDGKVRKYPPSFNNQGDCIFGLAEKTFNIITFKNKYSCKEVSNNYFRYSEKVTEYSLTDILHDRVPKEKLYGKVVFIGSTSLDLSDHFVGMSGEKIAGVYVHASIFNSLLNGVNDRELSFLETNILFLVYILFFVFIMFKARSLFKKIVFGILLLLITFIDSYILFTFGIISPVVWIVVSLVLTAGYVTLVKFFKERKESEYIQSLFSKYVHKDVLKELMQSQGSLNLKGEKRHLTVLFSDLRGFTTLSESLSPEKLTETLNSYFSAMTPAILEEHGTIDKFIGDAIMAFWNAPLYVINHERHAVLSALRMQEALVKFNKNNGTEFAIGIGVHAGDAVVGNVGSMDRVNYTVLGDTVNLASRVESLTKKYGVEILATEEVRNKINDKDILFRKLDVITVKGKSLPTILYEVMRMNDSKVEIIKKYDEAFTMYQKGSFQEAKIIFKECGEMGDIPSQKMYERVSNMKIDGNWDGIWHFDEK